MVIAISLLATGPLVVTFGSNTVMVSVSVGHGGLTPGAHTGTAYTYTPGFEGIKL